MQFKVPQNISMEDKVFGPLTMLQFFMAMGGIGFALVIHRTLSFNQLLANMVAGSIGAAVFLLVLGRFNDQPLYKFIRHITYFITRPRARIWHKGGGDIPLISQAPPKQTTQKLAKQVSRRDISELAEVLDTHGKSAVDSPDGRQ